MFSGSEGGHRWGRHLKPRGKQVGEGESRSVQEVGLTHGDPTLARFLLRSCRTGQVWSTLTHRAKADRERAVPGRFFWDPKGAIYRPDDLTRGARVKYAGTKLLFL